MKSIFIYCTLLHSVFTPSNVTSKASIDLILQVSKQVERLSYLSKITCLITRRI